MTGMLSMLAAALIAQATPAQPARAALAVPALPAGSLFVERDTPIRLMVLNEVSTRVARAGDRFVLRVDEDVVVDGVTIVPAGSKAWGEILDARGSGSVGKSGKLQARLLHVEVGGEQIAISGENKSKGESGGTAVLLGALALGPLALLAPGNNAKLKAGEIFSAYFDGDMSYDRTTAKLTVLPSRGSTR